MKTIDLAEKPIEVAKGPSKKKYYPTISYSDTGVGGVSSFDDQDIGKTMTLKADLVLTGINKRSDKKKTEFTYNLEVRKLYMPDDLSKDESQKHIDDLRQRKSKHKS